MWAGTGAGRVLISKNINAADPASVTFTRIDDDVAATPGRAVSSIYADPTNPNHAIVTFSGFNVDDAGDAGSRVRRGVRPGQRALRRGRTSRTTSATSRSTTPSSTRRPGDIYVSTDFSVFLLAHGTQTWVPVADGLPMAAVSGLTLARRSTGRTGSSTRRRTAAARTGSSSH